MIEQHFTEYPAVILPRVDLYQCKDKNTMPLQDTGDTDRYDRLG